MNRRLKPFVALYLVVVMLVLTMAPAFAANTYAPGLGVPKFYIGRVYAYNRNTGATKLVSDNAWSWGPAQPESMHISRNDYTTLNQQGYTGWKIEFTFNTQNCEYLRIYDGVNTSWTYLSTDLSTDTNYKLSFIEDSWVSQKRFKMDYRVSNGAAFSGIDCGKLIVDGF